MRMKKYLALLALFASVFGLAQPVSAVVMRGSTYSFYIEGSESDNAFLAIANFDGIAETGLRNGQLVTLNESETALDANSSRISISLGANSDLFPITNETGILAIGSSDPLDLDFSTSFTLDDARVTLRNLVGDVVFASDNLVFLANQAMPWDGTFPAPDSAFGIDEIGGQAIGSITFDFIVSQIPSDTPVPEPGSVLLCGLGLLAIVAALRNRQFRP